MPRGCHDTRSAQLRKTSPGCPGGSPAGAGDHRASFGHESPAERWAPNDNSTFIMVPEKELEMFESVRRSAT